MRFLVTRELNTALKLLEQKLHQAIKNAKERLLLQELPIYQDEKDVE